MKIILDNIPNARYHEWFEPSACSCTFLLEAIKQGIKATGIDIHPMHQSVKQADFLTQSKETLNLSNKIVFGNPPYGARSSLYPKFIKQSFNLGAKYVAFLLPAGSLTFKLIERINYDSPSIRRRMIARELR